MFALYLINLGYNPFLELLAWFIKKSKQFNQRRRNIERALKMASRTGRYFSHAKEMYVGPCVKYYK